jgi:hypothetical protein
MTVTRTAAITTPTTYPVGKPRVSPTRIPRTATPTYPPTYLPTSTNPPSIPPPKKRPTRIHTSPPMRYNSKTPIVTTADPREFPFSSPFFLSFLHRSAASSPCAVSHTQPKPKRFHRRDDPKRYPSIVIACLRSLSQNCVFFPLLRRAAARLGHPVSREDWHPVPSVVLHTLRVSHLGL